MIPITLRTRAEYALPLEYVVSLKDNGCPPGSIGGETVLRQPFTRLHSSLQRLQLLTAITAAYSRSQPLTAIIPIIPRAVPALPSAAEKRLLPVRAHPRASGGRVSRGIGREIGRAKVADTSHTHVIRKRNPGPHKGRHAEGGARRHRYAVPESSHGLRVIPGTSRARVCTCSRELGRCP